MRLGLAWVYNSNANYRAMEPLKAMARRGHEVIWPLTADGVVDPRQLSGCDVVHVYRRHDLQSRQALAELARQGTAIVYDNDDDFTSVPKQSPAYKQLGGIKGQRCFTESVKVARMARIFTTPSHVLAEQYHNAGVERVEVVANCLALDVADPLMHPNGLVADWLVRKRALRARVAHEDIVIGWIAGEEHRVDARLIPIADALRRIVTKHPDVRVECIGIDLRLPQRYRHDRRVEFGDLPARIGGFDIGIAPLADIPWNCARSNIKVKEYAASGVPWLASPVGPYRELGEDEGGRLVPDDGWFDALDRLITRTDDRARLALAAKRWASEQTIDFIADRWERLFAEAAGVNRNQGLKLRPGAVVRVSQRPPTHP